MEPSHPLRARFGSFELNLKTAELTNGQQTAVLPRQSFAILILLLEAAGDMVERGEIKSKLWPNDTEVDFDHSINAAIRNLRRALGDSAEKPEYIETLTGRGYRLIVSAEWLPSTAIETPPQDSGQDERLPSGDLTGRKVSHYRILGIIGGGGMGVVYKAEDLKLGRVVAIKFLPEELGSDPRALERFEQEARTASSLDHPNICHIYEFGDHAGQPFIVMQLLEGQTLRDRMAFSEPGVLGGQDGKAIPLEEALDIALQILSGLAAAHAKGIIHRDIKPANILITTNGTAKILDFGLAKLLRVGEQEDGGPQERVLGAAPAMTRPIASSAGVSETGVAMGTAGYMSPEQIRCEKLDTRTDLFSFGVVFYEMVTGQQAFSGKTKKLLYAAILNEMPVGPARVVAGLPPKVEEIVNKALAKDRDLRYQHASEIIVDLQGMSRGADRDRPQANEVLGVRDKKHRKASILTVLLSIAVITSGIFYFRSHRANKLTDRDTIVLGDFDNKTGDAIFDDTLKQALRIQLEQSPFLELISEPKINATLKLMGHSAGDQLTLSVTRQVCQRTGSRAMLIGSIASVGGQFLIRVKAVDCNTGGLIAEAQQQAAGEAVLKAVDNASISLRSQLGEPEESVRKYATPLLEASTQSLEALKAYSSGRRTWFAKGATAALPFYKRAVELDPNFAMAYIAMSNAYGMLGETSRGAENASKAYELREKVSDRERFSIEASYYLNVTGELEKAGEAYEIWQQTYPRDHAPYESLPFISGSLGNYEKALEESREILRRTPNNGTNYNNVGAVLIDLNRLDEAEAVYKQAEERKLEGEQLLAGRYSLAFLEGDTAKMAQIVAAAMGKPGTEDFLLASQADTDAWYGQLRNARSLTRRAMDSAEHNDARETAAAYQAAAALREVESGNHEQTRADVDAAVKLAPNRDVREMAAVALARVGDVGEAEKLAAVLDAAFPLDTMVQRYWLPTIRAAIALERKDPNRAVELLETTRAIELGQPTIVNVFMCPVYLRGEAYLMLHDGNAAATEFRKFIDHYGLVGNFQWGALARLGLARSYALDAAKDSVARDKARSAYEGFLVLWKDADSDVPIYKQAQAEYARLQ